MKFLHVYLAVLIISVAVIQGKPRYRYQNRGAKQEASPLEGLPRVFQPVYVLKLKPVADQYYQPEIDKEFKVQGRRRYSGSSSRSESDEYYEHGYHGHGYHGGYDYDYPYYIPYPIPYPASSPQRQSNENTGSGSGGGNNVNVDHVSSNTISVNGSKLCQDCDFYDCLIVSSLFDSYHQHGWRSSRDHEHNHRCSCAILADGGSEINFFLNKINEIKLESLNGDGRS